MELVLRLHELRFAQGVGVLDGAGEAVAPGALRRWELEVGQAAAGDQDGVGVATLGRDLVGVAAAEGVVGAFAHFEDGWVEVKTLSGWTGLVDDRGSVADALVDENGKMCREGLKEESKWIVRRMSRCGCDTQQTFTVHMCRVFTCFRVRF